MKPICSTPDCVELAGSRGLCRSHYMKWWRSENADRKKAVDSAWRAANREKLRADAAKWRAANPDAKALLDRSWRDRNREAEAERRRLWDHSNRERATEAARKKRARRMSAFVADVDAAEIRARDAGICQLCAHPIDPSLEWPHPLSFSLDHVIPLSRGGTHEPANVQAAHFRCNTVKGNRTP